MLGRKHDDRTPLQAALDTATGLKGGSWASVEALALLAVEAAAEGRPEATGLLARAHEAAAGLRPGTWDGVRALAVLARADRELHAWGH